MTFSCSLSAPNFVLMPEYAVVKGHWKYFFYYNAETMVNGIAPKRI